jgi:transcriptional regulator with XRE-family HTH domain
MSITPGQCQEARELLGWTRAELVRSAGVSVTTVFSFEHGISRQTDWVKAVIRTALEQAGVEFIAENGGGAGVRLRKGKQMQKEKKTADELRTLLMDSMRDDPDAVADVHVYADTTYGWEVAALDSPSQAGTAKARVDPYVRKLRAQFDLKTD